MYPHTYVSQFTTNFEFSQAKLATTHKFSVIYVHGLYSDPWGRKPEAVKSWCETNNIDFFRFELAGHGSDINNYEKCDINIWKAQVLEIIDDMIKGDVVMVGSSIGGWLSLLAAALRPQRVIGLVGLAAAPDFTEGLCKIFSDEQKRALLEDGKVQFTNNDFSYVFTKGLIDSGRQNLLLAKPLNITCPVHLLQGMQDASLPWQYVLKIAQQIKGDNVVVKLLKSSNHRLGSAEDIVEMCNSLQNFVL